MNAFHKKRLTWISLIAFGVTLALTLVLYALKQNINLFFTPAQVFAQHVPPYYHFRLGGLVKIKSVVRDKKNLMVQFDVTDTHRDLHVQYSGILPDLFREGSGVVAEGELNSQGVFVASQVLAKHDEKYMPKAVYQAMRQQVKGTS